MNRSAIGGRKTLVVLAVLAATSAASAEENRGLWFKSLKQPGTGMSCCDIADCHRSDAEWRGGSSGQWWAVVQGRWTPVPREKELDNKASIDGDAYICSSQYPSSSPMIYCFVPPAMSM